MDTIDFYNAIFPSQGLRVLATFKKGLGAAPSHTYYDTNEDFLAAAETYDGLGKNVYHGCATYKTNDSRKGDNVEAVKALWIDADVGPTKPYATGKDAAGAIEKFRLTFELDAPYVIKSGSGVHAYFPFTVAIDAEDWQRLAATFAACMDHFGLKHDSSRTQDIASILRIPGTHNYKTDPPKSVRILRTGVESAAGAIYRKLKAYADVAGIIDATPRKTKPTTADDLNGELIGNHVHPPSDAKEIVKHCAVLAEIDASGGDCEQALWFRVMGIAKHCVDPEATAEQWTRNRLTTGHAQDDWQRVHANWAVGPTTCEELHKHRDLATPDKCATCAHQGKPAGFGPIMLGKPEQPVVQPIAPIAPIALVTQPAAVINTATPSTPPAPWTFGAKWVMDKVAAATRTGFSNGEMTMSVQQDDGTYTHKAFCNRYWQVLRRVRTAEGWKLEIGYTLYAGQPHETFLLDSATIASSDKLCAAFATWEMQITQGPKGMQKTKDIIAYEQQMLATYMQETPTYETMGWVTEGGTPNGLLTGEFVIGDTLLTPNSLPSSVLLGDRVDPYMSTDFRTRGSTAEWIALIDRIYNRPGAEAYQFVIAAMFASPLVKLVPGEGDWHGIPIALTGDSGAAKTSTALAAMSIYAPPQLLRFAANGGKGAQGDTAAAFTAKIGALNNLPCIADEVTGSEPERMADTMYSLANGKGRDRCRPDGTLIPNPARWNLICVCTGNEGFHEKLRLLKNQHTQDAVQLRCFEIKLTAAELKTTFADVDKTSIEVDLLEGQYGCVGRDWLQWLVNNRVKVSAALGKARAGYRITDDDQTSVRFYKDLILTVEVGARLAYRRGYIKWDVDAMVAWSKAKLGEISDGVFQRDWESSISNFFASLHGRTIVTKHMMIGPGRRMAEALLEQLSNNIPPVARRAINDKLFVVTTSALSSWCNENRVMVSAMVTEMTARGYIVVRAGGGKATPKYFTIGSGTNTIVPKAPCWEFDYDKVSANADDPAATDPAATPDLSNVIQMIQMPGTVADPTAPKTGDEVDTATN